MNTKHLSYFLEIVKQKNMNKAAETLFVSQSSLSQYLSRLEAEINAQLFYRQKGNMTLTPAGRIYKEYAEKIINMEQQMLSGINGLSSPTHIRVGINSIWGNLLMASITTQFHVQYPDIMIEIFEENHRTLKNLILNHEIDITVIATDSIDALQEYGEILRYEEIVFAVSHQNAYYEKNPLPDGRGAMTLIHLVRHFKDESFILTKETSSFRGLIDRTLNAYSFIPNVVCEISNMNTVRNMIAHNIGVGFMPSSCAEPNMGISYYSIIPNQLYRINALLHSRSLAFTDAEIHFMNLVRTYPLFKKDT